MTFGSARTRIAMVALLAAVAMLCLSAGASAQRSPATKTTRPACAPAQPGGATCAAVETVSPGARAHVPLAGPPARSRPTARSGHENCQPELPINGCLGLRPQDLHSAYALPTGAPTTQTIALVDAYDDPTAEKDLKHYDEEFGLPACTTANHCFRKINAEGAKKPLPAANGGWALEISLDIEVARAVCQANCRILLVEAQSACYPELEAAENRAVTEGANEISDSWYGREPLTDSAAYDHPGTVITAAAGDEGFLNWAGKEGTGCSEPGVGLVNYPASSPHVIAVGGTRLTLNSPSETWQSETVWNRFRGAGGSGCSTEFAAPPWQLELPNWSAVGCGPERAVADVAADADPNTGIAVYDSTPNSRGATGWVETGGTSASSPLIAAAFALAGGSGGVEYPAKTLYENAALNPSTLHDVQSGSNAECPLAGEELCSPAEEAAACSDHAICLAGTGYDGPTGVGTPNGLGAFEPVEEPGKKAQTIGFSSTPPRHAVAGAGSYTVTASASSALSVSFYSGAPSVCTLTGSTVRFVGVGTCTIDADQEGSAEYAQAPQSRQAFKVAKGSQVVSFETPAPTEARVGGPDYAASAAASSGLPVTYSTATPSICALSGSTVSFLQPGTCTIDAGQPGSASFKPAATAAQSFTVGKGTQTIEFTSSPPTSAVVAGPVYTVTASASSGLPVTYSSATPAVCTISEAAVSFVGAGTCTIDAAQSGNSEYLPAPQAHLSLAVSGESQTIAFTSSPPSSATVGGPTYTVTATATSALPVLYSSATPAVCTISEAAVSFVGAGTCTIDARQPGSNRYEPAPPVEQSFSVHPAAMLPAGVSGVLPFTTALAPAPYSSFTAVGGLVINPSTGAIRLKVTTLQAGTLSWRATFRAASAGALHSGAPRCGTGLVAIAGHCDPARGTFGHGSVHVASTSPVTVTIPPSSPAAKSLRAASRARRGITVTATLTFRSALGGSPTTHAWTVTDRLGTTKRG